jgi:hypothetical protein
MVDFYIQTLGFFVKRRFAIGNEDFSEGIGGPDVEANISLLTSSVFYTSGIRGRIVCLPTVWNIPPGTLSYMDARPGPARGRSRKRMLGRPEDLLGVNGNIRTLLH